MSRPDKLSAPATISGSAELDDDDVLLQVNIRLHLDDVTALEATQLRCAARRPLTKQELIRVAGRIYDARRLRDRILDHELFGEPAWDMLLALYCLPKRGLLMTVSGLCHSSGVPATTALRWQKTLCLHGLIERGPGGVDRRRQILQLTERGREMLEGYLTRLFYAGVPVPTEGTEL